MGVMVAIVVIAVVAAAAVLVTRYYDSQNNDNNNSAGTSSSETMPNNTPAPSSNSSDEAKNGEVTGKIEISDNSIFTPSQITVGKGEAVTWTNNDDKAHTVTADLSNSGGPDSGNISPGAAYTFTFNKTGSFQYHCENHPEMRGTIVVK